MTITCDAIKYSYRQSKDGFVVAFVIHPQEMPEALANADIGSQWQLRLVELDKDGNAESEVMPAEQSIGPNIKADTPPRPVKASGGAKSWHEMLPAQQAGILTKEATFQGWLQNSYRFDLGDDVAAAAAIRDLCGVTSRSEIVRGTAAGKAWDRIVSDYRAWMREPEVVGS